MKTTIHNSGALGHIYLSYPSCPHHLHFFLFSSSFLSLNDVSSCPAAADIKLRIFLLIFVFIPTRLLRNCLSNYFFPFLFWGIYHLICVYTLPDDESFLFLAFESSFFALVNFFFNQVRLRFLFIAPPPFTPPAKCVSREVSVCWTKIFGTVVRHESSVTKSPML